MSEMARPVAGGGMGCPCFVSTSAICGGTWTSIGKNAPSITRSYGVPCPWASYTTW